MKGAAEHYRRLVAEHPESIWVDLAKVKGKLVDWEMKNKPRELITENQWVRN